ncbi:MAG: ABC transporter permease, partial [Eubacterium sp.]|nr:ABC transporter permease [Eubacterium sp.]
VNNDMDVPYQIQVNCKYDDMDELKKAILDMDNVDDAYGLDSSQLFLGKDYPADYENALGSDETLTNAYKNLWQSNKTMMLFGIEDDMFNKLCEDSGIDYKPYYNVENNSLKIVLLNNLSRKTGGSGVFNDKAIGSRMEWFWNTDDDGNEMIFYYQVENLVDYKSDNELFSLVPKNYFAAYAPYSAIHNVTSDVYNETWTNLVVVTDNHKDVAEKISQYSDDNGLQASIYDVAENLESINTILFVLQVFVYGFITLITMITAANIINTISTSIALRRKEFAMLKSVGATQKGFYKMVCLESLFYGLNALIVSVPLSLLISFGLNKMIARGDVPFEVDFILYACVILAVFLIIGFSMLYSVKKIKKDSIIETLKQDIT